jgi:UDP-3-O-[3-hydroxymyristoyl] glucosamine N-acyltransferase
MKVAIVALDRASGLHAARAAAACEVVGIVARGWEGADCLLPAAPAELAAAIDRREVRLFIAADERLLNQHRLAAMLDYKAAGFRFAALAASGAVLAESVRLRDNVLVDAGARVDAGVDLGANVVVGAGAVIGDGAVIGHSVWIGSRAVIGAGCRIGRNCVLGEGVLLEPGCALEPWTQLARGTHLRVSPGRTIFNDPLFRAEVALRGTASPFPEAP